MIALNTASRIPLENLRIIRGHTLYEGKFALSVLANYDKETGQGTKELLLTSLTGQSNPLFSRLFFFPMADIFTESQRYDTALNVLFRKSIKFGRNSQRRRKVRDPPAVQRGHNTVV